MAGYRTRCLPLAALLCTACGLAATNAPPTHAAGPHGSAVSYRAVADGPGTAKEGVGLLGFNHNMLAAKIHQLWTPDFASAACQLRLPVVRYPGGTIGNYWRWQEGWLISAADYARQFNGSALPHGFGPPSQRYNGTALYTVDNLKTGYLDVCAAQEGFRPQVTFMLNLLTRRLDDQITMLDHARSIGIPIEYIELGNELYATQPDNEAVYPDAAAYARNVSQWTEVLRGRFPAAQISAVAREYRGSDQHNPRIANWTLDVAALSNASSLVFHPYWGSGVEVPNASSLQTFWGTRAEQADELALMGVTSGRDAILANGAAKQLQSVEAYTNSTPSLRMTRLKITECNVFDRVGVERLTMEHALQEAGAIAVLVSTPNVDQVIHHSLTGCCGFNALFAPPMDTYFSGRLVPPLAPVVEPFALSSTGHVLRLFGSALLRANRTVAITSWRLRLDPPPPVLNASSPAALGALLRLTQANGGPTHAAAFLVNLANTTATLDLSQPLAQAAPLASKSGHATVAVSVLRSVSDDLTVPVTQSDQLRVDATSRPWTAGSPLPVALAPYSVATVNLLPAWSCQ